MRAQLAQQEHRQALKQDIGQGNPPTQAPSGDRVARGLALLQTVPDNQPQMTFTKADYDDVLFAARQKGSQFGGLLQWMSPHTIKFRGAQILKGQ